MEDAAPKRRKTSPTTSVRLSGSDGSARSSSSGATRRSSRRRRPSFASPTKASLVRANPDVLEQRNASRTDGQPSAPEHSRSTSAGSVAVDEQALTAQLEGASENRPASDPIQPNIGAEADVSEPQSPNRRFLGGMRGKPRRSLNQPSPRPLPPPSAQEEELLDPFSGRALRRSLPRGVLPIQEPEEPEEPELPPTPTEKGISDPNAVHTSPMGIHNTPSKRPRRSRALADKLRSGSSPLKQPPLRPIDLGLMGKTSLPTKGMALTDMPTTAKKAPPRTTRYSSGNAFKDRKQHAPQEQQPEILAGRPHPARGVEELNPYTDKKATRDALLAEVAQMEADLDVMRTENDRLHASQEPHLRSLVVRDPDDPFTLLRALSRHALPAEMELLPDPLQIWLEAALDPMSFMPFGSSSIPLPNPFGAEDQGEEHSPPRSHHPMTMTADEELPYLQLFTPLTFTSITTFVPREADDEEEEDPKPLMQQHQISVSSSPRGLFTARIEMLVNTKTLSISHLSVPKLEPAAVDELGPFVRTIVDSEKGSISALKRNVSILTWAMAEWTRLAYRRARFWCKVTEELAHRQGITDCAKKMRMSRKRRRAPKQQQESDEEHSEDDGESTEKRQVTKAQLLPFLGRSSFDLDLSPGGMDEGELRINWNIGFDWTGEGKSAIGVLVQAPGKWHAQDNRKSLARIPTLFTTLLQDGRAPIQALKTVIALLVGEGKDRD